jgi:hypothetical protein
VSSPDAPQLTAYFSPCRKYRYALTRKCAPLGHGTVVFVGLNPSTADHERDDATIRRCRGFARHWGFAELAMVNLYAYRSTDPRQLRKMTDPIGPENDHTIASFCAAANLVVVAWGAAATDKRASEVLGLPISDPHCLGQTKTGAPRHPLYVKKDTEPIPFAFTVL